MACTNIWIGGGQTTTLGLELIIGTGDRAHQALIYVVWVTLVIMDNGGGMPAHRNTHLSVITVSTEKGLISSFVND